MTRGSIPVRLTFLTSLAWVPFNFPMLASRSACSSPTLRVGALAVDSLPPLAPLARKAVTTIAFFGGII